MNDLELLQSMEGVNDGTLDIDKINWILEFGFYNKFMDKDFFNFCVNELDKDKRVGFVAKVYRQCISDSLGLALEKYEKNNLSWLKEYLETLQTEYSQPTPQPQQVPVTLQGGNAEKLFSELEKTTVRYRGKETKILDRSVWPWKPITMNAWVYICSIVKDKIGGTYRDWETVVGGKNLRQRFQNMTRITGQDIIDECIKQYR